MTAAGTRVIIGGLGGGGDVALALILARAMGLRDEDIVVVSFFNCSAAQGGLRRLAVKGSLIRIPPGSFPDRRVFEDKLHLVAPGLRGRIYGVCTMDPWSKMLQGLLHIIEEHRPSCMLHADNGGDGIVLGYEERLGTYKTDTVAKALLAEAAEQQGVKSITAIGCLGCEGGGTELDEAWLAANLHYNARHGALIGVTEPPLTAAREAEQLLKHAESGMLPYYLAALKGHRKARINMAYLHGEYPVKPWHRLIFLLDTQRHCSLSPLCKTAKGRGATPLRHYEKHRPTPPRELKEALNQAKRHGPQTLIERIAKKKLTPQALRHICTKQKRSK